MEESHRYQSHMIYLDEIILPNARKPGYIGDTEWVLNLVLNIMGKRLPFARVTTFFSALPLPLQALMVEQWEISQYVPTPITSLTDLLDEIVDTSRLLYLADDTQVALAEKALFATLEKALLLQPPKLLVP